MKGSLKRPRVVSKIHYLDYNGEDVLSTPDAMENDFGIRRLLHWHLLGVHLKIPKDLRNLIASKVQRDYRKHPIWKWIDTNKHEKRKRILVVEDGTIPALRESDLLNENFRVCWMYLAPSICEVAFKDKRTGFTFCILYKKNAVDALLIDLPIQYRYPIDFLE